jgi:hypothetical protein
MPDEPTPRCPHGWPRNHPSPCTACAGEAAFDAGFDALLKNLSGLSPQEREERVKRMARRAEVEREIQRIDAQVGRTMPWEGR